MVAMVALIYSVSTRSLWDSISNGIVALAVYMLMKIFRPFERKGKLAERILQDVMSGKLDSEEKIRKAWLDGRSSGASREFQFPICNDVI